MKKLHIFFLTFQYTFSKLAYHTVKSKLYDKLNNVICKTILFLKSYDEASGTITCDGSNNLAISIESRREPQNRTES